ncbi:MAG: proteasome accessory factor PafA2 family protein [Armatimonadota bacterium]|nr:proteasome accessory factor PafA2 family protein [Armatimonadota bacterium]MCX7776904.1 proteasome accessory factor PafA2 family protein [Armatimonadota bacterium]MDW8024410.1 proteasome accessory factor PafA2 family protein [Armatimonadota bacterium]
MDLLFGLENEYGVLIEGCSLIELPCAVKAIVESYPYQACLRWDYSHESPRLDMRGFVAKRLEVDPKEKELDRETISRSPNAFEPCDRVLKNGARLYHDHAHPEYSTPECRRLKELVAHDKAGERIVLMCASNFSAKFGAAVKVFKNNTDFHGSTYGTHENYLMLRSVPFEVAVDAFIPFLCTRIIYTGAGKVGSETNYGRKRGVKYQLSQRAEYFDSLVGTDTQFRRPIFNTRDEPHADRSKYRRLHIIVGDANMSQYAIALKVGTTAIVVKLLERHWRVPDWLKIAHPVKALHEISMDESMRWLVELADGRKMSAIDIQRIYLTAAQTLLDDADEDIHWVLSEWNKVLDELETDPATLSDRLDWVAKRRLMEMFIEAEGTDWDDERLKAIDLAYHNVDPNEGLYYAIEANNLMRQVVEERDIENAIHNPPCNTRALIRGRLIERFNSSLLSVSWGIVKVCVDGVERAIDLRNLVGGEACHVLEKLTDENLSIDELIKLCEVLNAE